MAEAASKSVRLRLDAQLLERFARASGDRNPLHTSREFARSSPFGEPVAFGMLGALACLSALPPAPSQMLARISCRFPHPLFPELDHALELRTRGGERFALRLRDGRRIVTRIDLERCPLRTRAATPAEPSVEPRPDLLREPRDLPASAFSEPSERRGVYLPDREVLDGLRANFGLGERGLPLAQAAALCATSYLVGMEMPGRRALYSRLDLEFEGPCPASLAPLEWIAGCEALDPRFSLLRIAVRLSSAGEPFATLRLEAFLRPRVEADAPAPKALGRGQASLLRGQSALLTGGSRGLGAALALELAGRGTRVYLGYRESEGAAREVMCRAEPLPGSVVLCKGDVRDTEWCTRVGERIRREGGELDLLICNAAPSLAPLWLEPESLARVREHVAAHVSSAAAPLAILLPELSADRGRVVAISSAASARPVREWPHYVAAKRAIEGLVEVASLEYPSLEFWIVRPPRLRTELSNTPLGFEDARPVELEADRIANALCAPREPGRLHWIGPELS